jgi:hypothetical protein
VAPAAKKTLDPMRYGEDAAAGLSSAAQAKKKRASGKKRSGAPPAAAQVARLKQQLCAVRGISKRCKAEWQRVKRARRGIAPAVVAFAEGFISDLEGALQEDA